MESGSSSSQQLKNPLQRLNVHVTVNANATAAAKLDLDDSSPCALRRQGRRRLWRVARDRSRHRRDLDRNESWYGISAQSALARLSTPGEQQAVSHPVPARDAADRLASLQGLFDKANLLVVTPSPPTLGAQDIDLHSRRDLKARFKVKSSARLSN
ncbi:hypothetical protein ABID59_005667 [Bradyrhizobium sp. S3.3.6]